VFTSNYTSTVLHKMAVIPKSSLQEDKQTRGPLSTKDPKSRFFVILHYITPLVCTKYTRVHLINP